MKKRFWTHFMLTLMVLGSFLFAFKSAAAQTGTTVYFSPDPATVYLNATNSQVMEIRVANAVNLWSFDIIFTYDSGLASVSSWAFGNFFEINQGACQRIINDPGYFRLACTQQSPTLPKSGTGIIFQATFIGEEPSSTTINFTKIEFSNSSFELIAPPLSSAALNVGYDPAIIKPTTLSGSFELQGRADRGGIPVTLSEAQFVGQGPYTAATTDLSGDNLAFTNVAMDVYTVSTAQAGYLNISPEMGRQIALLASGNVLPPLRLIGGNAVWTGHATSNDQIDIYDVSLVSGEIGKAVFDPDADINGNGKVDIFDLALVAGNFGMTSAIAYAGWLQ